MAILSSITSLSLADLYFTDGEGNYRLQWSTNAVIDETTTRKPQYDDDSDYYVELSRYNYYQAHKNDGSGAAASFVCRIYDGETGQLVQEVETTDFSATVALDPEKEYLWEVSALNAKGQTITTSGRNYLNTGFSDWDGDAWIDYRGSCISHTIGEMGQYWGECRVGNNDINWCRLAFAGEIGNSGDGTTSRFVVCGPWCMGNKENYESSVRGGFDFSTSNACGNFNGDFDISGKYLISNGGLYVYEDGQWNYESNISTWLWASEAYDDGGYFLLDWGNSSKAIFRWDENSKKFCEVRTAAKPLIQVSGNYYVSLDGVYSISSGRQIVKQSFGYGEALLFDDLLVNVLARNSAGRDCDVLPSGSTGTVVAKYWFFDEETRSVKQTEVELFSGRVDGSALDTEEMFACRIGNCVCFQLEDDHHWNGENLAIVHVIGKDGTVEVITKEIQGHADFSTDGDGNLICRYDEYVEDEWGYLIRETREEVLVEGISFPADGFADISIVDDDHNNWTDLKTRGPQGEVGEVALTEGVSGWVGDGDEADYMAFTLDSAAKLTFDLTATDAVKFTINRLDSKTDKNNNTTYSLKPLLTQTLTVPKGRESGSATTTALLLEAGEYYLGIQSTNAAKGGSADYTVAVNDKSVFFVYGDDGWNDRPLYNAKTKEYNDSLSGNAIGMDGASHVLPDGGSPEVPDGWENWVGYGDAIDHGMITLDSAAKLSFTVTATDAVKFSLFQLTTTYDKNYNTVYSVKTLQSAAAKLNKTTGLYELTTAGLLIKAPDVDFNGSIEYYLAVESTNAAKGGNAAYTVTVNDSSVFFVYGDDGWNDRPLYNAKTKEYNDSLSGNAIGMDGASHVLPDGGSPEVPDGWENWVGYGDAIDHGMITLDSAAKLSFTVTATDAVKFSLFQLTTTYDKNYNTVYSVKTLQSAAAKLNKTTGLYELTTAGLLIKAPDVDFNGSIEYYLAVESTNAAKGGNAAYTVTVNDGSVFFTKGDTSDDTWENALMFGEISSDEDDELAVTGWVGYGDTVDFRSFSVAEDMKVSFNVSAADAVKLTVYQLVGGKLKSLQSTSFKANVSGATAALALKAEAEYYFAVESTNAAKGGNADYTVSASRYVAPLNVTLKGSAPDAYDWFDEPEITAPTGTNGADKVTLTGNTYGTISGTINLKGGNDQLVLNTSTKKGFWDVEEIDMGAGDDQITVYAHSHLNANTVRFGKGNDRLILAENGNLDASGVYFGAGSDLLQIDKEADLDLQGDLNFGGGDDTLAVGKGAVLVLTGYDELDGSRENPHIVDFGTGTDSLILNGTLIVDPAQAEISGLEKVSGSGQLLLCGAFEEAAEEDFKLFTDAGIDVINVQQQDIYSDKSCFFTDRKTERADDTMKTAAAVTLSKKSGNAHQNVWLCGQQLADESVFGFADPVDYIKFTMNSNWTQLDVFGQGDSSVNVELRDSRGTVLASISIVDGISLDLTDLNLVNKATYYVKLSVDDDKYFSGSISVGAMYD